MVSEWKLFNFLQLRVCKFSLCSFNTWKRWKQKKGLISSKNSICFLSELFIDVTDDPLTRLRSCAVLRQDENLDHYNNFPSKIAVYYLCNYRANMEDIEEVLDELGIGERYQNELVRSLSVTIISFWKQKFCFEKVTMVVVCFLQWTFSESNLETIDVKQKCPTSQDLLGQPNVRNVWLSGNEIGFRSARRNLASFGWNLSKNAYLTVNIINLNCDAG